MVVGFILPRQIGELASIPREAWLAGPAARAPYLGRLVVPVEAIASRGASLLRANPSLLRRIGPIGGVLGPLLFLEAVEWASEWIRDGLIPSLRQWSRPEQSGSFRLGYIFEYEYWDYGVAGFPDGTPTVRTQRAEVLPSSGTGSIISIDQPPAYMEYEVAGRIFWQFRGRVTAQGGVPQAEETFSSAWIKSRYRFTRILDWRVLGVPANVPTAQELYDPESGVDPEQFPRILPSGEPLAAPLSLPLGIPGIAPIPGEILIRTPVTRGQPGERIDFDWVPRRDSRGSLRRFPGLRLGFRPWGVFLAQYLASRLLDELLDPSDGCPDPCPDLDYERIREIAREELDEKFPPKRPFQEKELVFPEANSFNITLPEFPRRANIRISRAPKNRRYQPGAGAPDVYYNGWYSVSRAESGAGDRKPVHYDDQWIELQNGDKRLTITLYVGVFATVKVYYVEEQNDGIQNHEV